ncbi:hypothetical protein TrCOL_g3535 [Triparma columacea]|uniref:Uncharacterized protein n=1 Tax=Triparma columacea TaxID=722753 RepID=A0A9W7FYD9_9STRA|nr:hypothetical protein TrCOL_g3535 [Triparma columacea]
MASPPPASPSPSVTSSAAATPLSRILEKVNSTNHSPSSPFLSSLHGSSFPTPAQAILSLNDSSNNVGNTSATSGSVQAGTLRHALNVVERLQSQLTELASTNAQLENECAEKETSLNSFKAENKALKAKVATLENDLSVTDSKSSALRRESKQKTEQLQDEVQSLRRTKLTAEETERVLQERIGLLEKGYKEKIERSEESVSRAMELVDRVQVAAGRAVEKERHQLRQQNRATEKELSVAQTTLRRYKKATEKLSRESDRFKTEMHHLKASNTQMQLELSTFASTKEQLKDELYKCHVQIARYEEREKDIVVYQREISRLKDDIGRDSSGIGKLEGENAALKKEIANMLEQYATNINKVRDVANQKIEIETEMRHRLQAEVREAKGAIRDMHKEVKDRNMLLSVLEERLQTMGDAEDKVTRDQERRLKIRAADIKPIGATGGISATVDAYEKHIGSRARGEGLYGVAKLPADLSEIGGVKIAEKSRARKMATEALDRRSSEKLTKEVISRGGLAWVVS